MPLTNTSASASRPSSTEVWALYQRALPDPMRPSTFHRLLAKAKAQGLPYPEALQYVVDHSPQETALPSAEAMHRAA